MRKTDIARISDNISELAKKLGLPLGASVVFEITLMATVMGTVRTRDELYETPEWKRFETKFPGAVREDVRMALSTSGSTKEERSP